jgi:hypothetical protein
LYNLRHARLQNVVERSFAVLKGRFPIVVHPKPYPFHVQVSLVLALCTLHNMIRMNGGASDYIEAQSLECELDTTNGDIIERGLVSDRIGQEQRDLIAQSMWESYVRPH